MRRCPACNALLPSEGIEACPKCGVPLPEAAQRDGSGRHVLSGPVIVGLAMAGAAMVRDLASGLAEALAMGVAAFVVGYLVTYRLMRRLRR